MTAVTLRQLWRARHRVDARFRRDALARLLFVMLLQQSRGIVHELRRMNQYGVLGRYLPEFGRIVGQMQHDLFHVYTVDQHILMVVRNLRRFTMPELAHEFPLCTRLMNNFSRRWLLFVAALYHDIAKGRGGDHSAMGARDAARFCRRHGLAADDSDTCHVPGRAPPHDVDGRPEAGHLRPRRRAGLRHARRIRAPTDCTLFADGRRHPGHQSRRSGMRGKRNCSKTFSAPRAARSPAMPYRIDAVLSEKQDEALRLLRLYALPEHAKDRLWGQLDTSYFLRHDAQEIAWQTRQLYARVDARRHHRQGTPRADRRRTAGHGLRA